MSEKNLGGRPSSFRKEMIQEMKDYFDIDSNILEDVVTVYKNGDEKIDKKEFAANLPTIQGLCRKFDIHRDTLYQWLKEAKDEEYKGEDKELKKMFSDTFFKCKEIQEQIWLENSLKGLYNPGFSIFLGKNVFGYKDKSEVESNNTNLNLNAKLTKKDLDEMNSKDCDDYLSNLINEDD